MIYIDLYRFLATPNIKRLDKQNPTAISAADHGAGAQHRAQEE